MRLAELRLCIWWGHNPDQGDAWKHSLGTPPRGPAGQRQSWGLDYSDYWGWQLRSHKGQRCVYDRSFPLGGIMTPGYHYGLPRTNAGEHSCGDSYGYLSCLPRGAQSLWAKHSKIVYPTHVEGREWGAWGLRTVMLPQGRASHGGLVLTSWLVGIALPFQGCPPPPSELFGSWRLMRHHPQRDQPPKPRCEASCRGLHGTYGN
jgi:hypothetical protein